MNKIARHLAKSSAAHLASKIQNWGDGGSYNLYDEEYCDEVISTVNCAVRDEVGEVADKVREYSRELQKALNARLFTRVYSYLLLISETL